MAHTTYVCYGSDLFSRDSLSVWNPIWPLQRAACPWLWSLILSRPSLKLASHSFSPTPAWICQWKQTRVKASYAPSLQTIVLLGLTLLIQEHFSLKKKQHYEAGLRQTDLHPCWHWEVMERSQTIWLIIEHLSSNGQQKMVKKWLPQTTDMQTQEFRHGAHRNENHIQFTVTIKISGKQS